MQWRSEQCCSCHHIIGHLLATSRPATILPTPRKYVGIRTFRTNSPCPHHHPHPHAALVGAEKADLVNAFLSLENGARADTIREKLQAARRDFERFPGDTGSTEVQVAVLTARIYSLADHLTTHRKDHNSRRGLQGLLNRRRSLLQYLRRSNFDRYAVLISRLGLKDNYAPQDRYSVRYKAAVRQQPSGGGEGA